MSRPWIWLLPLIVLAPAQVRAASRNIPVCVTVTLQDVTPPPPVAVALPASGDAAHPPSFDSMTDLQKAQALERMRAQVASLPPRPQVAYPTSVAEGVLPIGQDPVGYLKRLLEHFVSHEKGFEAAAQGCRERLTVELYPLREG